MPNIIQLLPDSLANQIAAGEVVQRPSSAVKELLENAIDANSTSIKLIIKDAGKQLIQVIDNGLGMSETDARMSFERHATSKIKNSGDLFNIRTHGFRGEALASIAAVAQVELKTRQEADELGTLLKIEGSEIKQQQTVACERGTSICVKNLFFNVPARRNFLKSNPVELRHVIEEFQRIALSYHQVSMALIHNDLEIYNLVGEKLSHRIVSIFGKSYKEQLIVCHEETELLKVKGYIGKPENSKRNRGEQFFFVNNRFIKHNYLHHAVMNAFEELLGENSYPFYTLFIDIDPKHIDINVHPTKTEIKFDDEKTIYHIIRATVKKSLATNNITPSLDFEMDINFNAFNTNEISRHTDYNEEKSREQFFTKTFQKPLNEGWELLYQGLDDNKESHFLHHTGSVLVNNPEKKVEAQRIGREILYNENSATFQLHNTYIVSQVKSGMIIIDQQAAHERILYEKYIGFLNNRVGASQQTLFPQSLELNTLDLSMILEMEVEIKSLGFIFSIFSNNTLIIHGIPADIQSGNEKELFEGLIEQYKLNKTELRIEKKENLARALAKRSSIKSGNKLSVLEMNTLIGQLFTCENPNHAPNGSPTIVMLDMSRIARFFNK